jgi:hypothetical protein
MNPVKPGELLSASRLDIFGKLPFAEVLASNGESAWARELFFECLRALNPNRLFSEDGVKFSEADYEYYFRKLMHSLDDKGFDPTLSKVLISGDGTVWNGAHRVAASIALKQEVFVDQVEATPQIYNWAFFSNSGMHRMYLDELAWQYALNVPSTRAIVLSDLTADDEFLIKRTLDRAESVVFERSIKLSGAGLRRNLQLMYGHLNWFSPSLLEKLVLERFSDPSDGNVTLFLYDQPAGLDERTLKEELRSLIGGDQFERKIHGSDDWEETLRLAEVWTNGNSLRFMNSAPVGCEDRIINKLNSELKVGPNLLHDFVVDSGASLELHGLRQTADIDHVCIGEHPKTLSIIGDCHNSEYANLGVSASELVRDPRKHLRWGGFKFSTLESEFLRLRLLGTEKGYKDLATLLARLTEQKGEVYFDADRSAKAANWQRKSRWQIRMDRALAQLPPTVRALIARLAAAVRRT